MIFSIILTAVASLMLSLIVSGIAYLDIHRRLLTIIGQVFESEKVIKGLAYDAELHTRSYRELSNKVEEIQKAIDHLTEENLKLYRKLDDAIEEYDQRYRRVRSALGAKKRYDKEDQEVIPGDQQQEITELIDQVQQTAIPTKSRKFGELPY